MIWTIWPERPSSPDGSSARHITMKKSAALPLDVNHLWPLMTHSSPSRTAVVGRAAWVDAGGLGLGHGEARLHRPVDERQEPLALLLLGPVAHEDVLVARVRRDDAEQRGGAHRVGEDLVHVGVGEEVEAHPAVLLGQVRRPQARRLHLGADVLAGGAGPRAVGLASTRPATSARAPTRSGGSPRSRAAAVRRRTSLTWSGSVGHRGDVDGHGRIPSKRPRGGVHVRARRMPAAGRSGRRRWSARSKRRWPR